MNRIFNEDCKVTLTNRIEDKSLDLVLTSPFYNTNKKSGKKGTLRNTKVKEGNYQHVRYDNFVDNMSNEEYSEFIVDLFNKIEPKLKDDGCVLFNINYGTENTEGMWLAVADILRNTNFTLADTIVWKKRKALPNNCSSNKLTRITEYVFVFNKRGFEKTFKANKKVVSVRATGQKMYENVQNFIEAANNDGSCKLNKATFSSDLCMQLLEMYAREDSLVYDPFMGTGTTGVACKMLGHRYIGSEISDKQCEYAEERIEKTESIELQVMLGV
ncbi:MAG: DNA-methyltransferase [Clostridium sp.]|uniref:DNA-methyltransferase n=1 Tax=Clostridium sp. TaxID=1506 RepID=UPI003F347DFC